MKIKTKDIHSIGYDVLLTKVYDEALGEIHVPSSNRVIFIHFKDGRAIKTLKAKRTKKGNIKIDDPVESDLAPNASTEEFFNYLTRLGKPVILTFAPQLKMTSCWVDF